jgi:hypothetical protein
MLSFTNLLDLPFVFLIWLTEVYLFTAVLRFVLAQSSSTRQSGYYYQFQLLTDPLPKCIARSIGKWTKTVVPTWVSWLTVLMLVCLLRQILILIVSM